MGSKIFNLAIAFLITKFMVFQSAESCRCFSDFYERATATLSSSTTTPTSSTATATTSESRTKSILVVGGWDEQKFSTVDLHSLKSGIESRRLGKFPVRILGGTRGTAVGTTLNGIPHICGGNGDHGNYYQECWAYSVLDDSWTISGRMREPRAGHAAASHPSHGWVITGGFGFRSQDSQLKGSAESTRDGRTFRPFTPTPLLLWGHCLVSLEGTDTGDFLLTGGDGVGDNGVNKKTFLYKEGGWRQVEDIPTVRIGLMCGAVRGRPGGPVEMVIAAGGYDGYQQSSVDIYNLGSNTWTKGRDLPVGLEFGQGVPFDTTFLIIGGNKYITEAEEFGKNDKVYKYTTEGEWEEMPIKLSEEKYVTTAIIVPSSLFN